MGAYILRRLALILPTLFGIIALNFAIIQFAPGGPVEKILREATEGGQGGGATERFTGGGDGGGGGAAAGGETGYRGAQGLDQAFIDSLEIQFGFARIVCGPEHEGKPSLKDPGCAKEQIPAWEQFFITLWNYLTFDFGESFFRSASVIDLIAEKMPVSVTLGLWTTLISYMISIPLGISKAVRDGTRFDAATSAVVIAAYAVPGFLFALLLLVLFAGGSFVQWFPLRGLLSDGLSGSTCVPLLAPGPVEASGSIQYAFSWAWSRLTDWQVNPDFSAGQCATVVAPDYLWHIFLPVLALLISSFATLTLLTKNSFLDEIRKAYVVTARAKGLSEWKVLYGHVFRNAMLIVVAGFPAAFVFAFFQGALFVETVFSLDGLGLLGFTSVVDRDYPVVLGTLYIFGLIGLVVKLISDLTYVLIDPRIDFERREG